MAKAEMTVDVDYSIHGYERFGWLADDGGSMCAFFKLTERQALNDFIDECGPQNVIALYAASKGTEAGERDDLYEAVAQILDAGHMNTEDLARLRAAYEGG